MMKSETANPSATYSIRLLRNWAGHDFSHDAGVYRIPSDMPQRRAEVALAKGIATKVLPLLHLKKAK